MLGRTHAARLDYTSAREVVEISPGICRRNISIGVPGAAGQGQSCRHYIARSTRHLLDTLWTDEAAMKSFTVCGVHRTIMPKLLEWCDEASVARWTQDSSQEPTWEEVHQRMQRDGRASKVNHPSEAHRRFDLPTLQVRRSRELRFK